MKNPKISENMKKRMANPEEREKMSRLMKERMKDPEVRKKASERQAKQMAENPERRKKCAEQMREMTKKNWEDPAFREMQQQLKSENMKKRWKDPVWRAKMEACQKTKWANKEHKEKRVVAIKNKTTTAEFKEKMRIINSTRAKNPVYRAMVSKQTSERNKDPKYRENQSKKMLAVWSNKEYHENMTAKLTESVRKHYSDRRWYGNVSYPDGPVYCEKWRDVNPRVHAFFDRKCVVCGTPETTKSHIGHHVFYEKGACCMQSEDGIYYTNLNAKDHPTKDYEIGENPNYFVILCPSCHGKTNGGFENRKKWADFFREMIDTYYGGKCYLTKEEYAALTSKPKSI